MNKQQNKRILQKFFSNDLSATIQDKFQKWFLRERLNQDLNQSLEELFDDSFIPSEINAEEHLNRFRQKYTRVSKIKSLSRRMYKIAMFLLLPLTIATLVLYIIPSAGNGSVQPEMIQVSADPGEQISITLDDGSVVWLNAGSILIYPKNFKGKIRAIHLIGEGRFRVTKDEHKPFVVKTNHQIIEALGTTFTVKAYPNSSLTVTRLEEGLVRLTAVGAAAESYLLKPDEESVYDHQLDEVKIRKIDATKLGMWYDGQLNFESASFDEVTDAIALQYNIDFIYDPSINNSNQLNVKFHNKEPLDEVLKVLISLTDYSGYHVSGRKVYLK
ncbi:MAG: FecR family protein [Bacteroidales bacterium]